MSSNPNLPAARFDKKGMWACLLISALVISLYHIPFGDIILYPMMLVYTFVHEMGHGIAAMLTGGTFVKFQMWFDGSGVATYMLNADAGRFARAFTAFGGLVAPAVIAAVSLVMARSAKASKIGLVAFGVVCVISLVLVVRNLFGVFFVLGCGVVAFLLALVPKNMNVSRYSMLFIAITLLTAVFSRGDYLFVDTAQTAQGLMPSDTGQIAEQLFLPYWFWGALIGVISIAILVVGVRGFFYNSAPKPLPDDSAKPQ